MMNVNRKTIVSLFAAAMLCGCSDGQQEHAVISGPIVLSSDSDELRSDGTDYVTFTVIVTDEDGVEHDVTENSEIWSTDSDEPLSSNVFSTDTEGIYVFYAVYGMEISDEIEIVAINDVPELPEDPDEECLSFRHRSLLVQHTGAACVNCPRMMECLHDLASDEAYSRLYHHVASHSYENGSNDAAYSEAALKLSGMFNKEGYYPMVTFNLTGDAIGTDLSEIKAKLDALKKVQADAGIAAAAVASGDDVVVNVEVKSAKENTYRVAAWLLEDDIYAPQAGASASWHNTHDNALRYMTGSVIAGEKLGVLPVGSRAHKALVIPVDETWEVENCEVLVIVTSADENDNYDIANCVLCPVGGTVSFEYK